jgi:hypothetical protein
LVQPSPALPLSVVVGETVTLGVETTGTLPIGYRWRHIRTNGTSVSLTNFVLNQNICFVTLAVGANSAGTYTVILTNAAQPSSIIQRTNALLTVLPDSDANGLPDEWELAHPDSTDPLADTDHDGMTNLQEYQSGTDPEDAQSYLKIDSLMLTNGVTAAVLRFFAVSNKTYSVESRVVVDAGAWTRVADVLATATNRVVEVLDAGAANRAQQFYHIRLN